MKLSKEYFRFLIPVFLLLLLIVVGTVGYILIDNFSWLNAFYMTIITIGTVGYGEVERLSDGGR